MPSTYFCPVAYYDTEQFCHYYTNKAHAAVCPPYPGAYFYPHNNGIHVPYPITTPLCLDRYEIYVPPTAPCTPELTDELLLHFPINTLHLTATSVVIDPHLLVIPTDTVNPFQAQAIQFVGEYCSANTGHCDQWQYANRRLPLLGVTTSFVLRLTRRPITVTHSMV